MTKRMTQKAVLKLFKSVDIDIEGLTSYKTIYDTSPHLFTYAIFRSDGALYTWDSSWAYEYDKKEDKIIANFPHTLTTKAIEYNETRN